MTRRSRVHEGQQTMTLPPPSARKTDPDTSKAAARSVAPAAGRLAALVLAAHRQHPHGLCDEELVAVLLVDHPTLHGPTIKTLRSRMSKGDGAVFADSGRRVMSKRTGAVNATRKIVWELIERNEP